MVMQRSGAKEPKKSRNIDIGKPRNPVLGDGQQDETKMVAI
jgi:hypothetical protein